MISEREDTPTNGPVDPLNGPHGPHGPPTPLAGQDDAGASRSEYERMHKESLRKSKAAANVGVGNNP